MNYTVITERSMWTHFEGLRTKLLLTTFWHVVSKGRVFEIWKNAQIRILERRSCRRCERALSVRRRAWGRLTVARGCLVIKHCSVDVVALLASSAAPVASIHFSRQFSSCLSLARPTCRLNRSRYRERKCADTVGTVPVPRAGHFQC